MKPSKFDYLAANTSSDATTALANGDGTTKLIAGAQSLGPMLNLRLVRPGALVDVSTVPTMRETHASDVSVEIGAAVTHAEIEDGEVVDPTGGWLQSAAANIAHRAVRNRGTLGGSLAHADPAADWVIVMTGLGAIMLLEGPEGRREVTIDKFILGPFETDLRSGELITAVRVARPSYGARWGYWKFVRQVGEFAKASATVLHDPERGPPRIAIGALGRQPLVFDASVAVDLVTGTTDASKALSASLPERSSAELALHVTALNKVLTMVTDGEGTSE